jgi:1-acyl-sn-glycerol-3-phosphate acyltransferase
VFAFLRDIWILIKNLYYVLEFSVITIYYVYTGKYDRTVTTEGGRNYWATKTFRNIKLTYEVFNKENAHYQKGRSYIIMSNHRSHYDIPLILKALPGNIRFLAKRELLKVPIWSRASWEAEIIFVDRKNHDQAMKDLEYAKRKMEDGIILWVAPEGTRSRTGKLEKFKKGGFMVALQTDAIIIPVGIRGTDEVLPAKTWRSRLGKHVEVHIGKPIDTSGFSIDDRDKLMEKVRNEIYQLGGYSE